MNPYRVTEQKYCPSCNSAIGALHRETCDVERCSRCGGQRISCGCDVGNRIAWSGYWPGDLECVEFGFFCQSVNGKFVACDANAPNAMPDLNRLHVETVWRADLGRRVRRK